MAEFWASSWGIALILLAQGLALIAFVMMSLIWLVYGDRKIWAAVQMRRGPNVVGPWGLLQTFADALKYVLKEIVIPAGADKFVFFLAPFLSMTLALLAFWALGRAVGLSAPRTAGAMAGFVGQPVLLSHVSGIVDDERAESGYSALFALGIIVKIIVVQVVVVV